MSNNKVAFVVDDDSSYTEIIRHHLEQFGFEVRSFSSGADCISQLGAKPDLIILDYDLGEKVSGLQYLRKIHSTLRETPVFFLSEPHDVRVATQSLRFGACCYIEKNNRFSEKLGAALHDLDLEKKRKFVGALKSLRKGIFSLYNF